MAAALANTLGCVRQVQEGRHARRRLLAAISAHRFVVRAEQPQAAFAGKKGAALRTAFVTVLIE
jgi:hypothetical protein